MPQNRLLLAKPAQLKSPFTLAAAISWIRGSNLPTAQKTRLVSDLNSIAKMLALPSGTIVLTPEQLRETLLSRSAAGYGISDKRMRNILSSLRAVLRAADVIDHADARPSDAWQRLLDLLDQRKRAEMIGFARFCSPQEIEPEAVTSATMQTFEAQVITRTITSEPRKRIGRLRSFWNRASRTVVGWPSTQLQGGRSHDYILPLSDFTEDFRCDLTRFGERLTANPLDDAYTDDDTSLDMAELPTGNHRPVAIITRDLRLSHARWAASAAVAAGAIALSDINSLSTLVRSNIPKSILRFLYHRAAKKPSAAGMHVADTLRIIAKYHAGLSPVDVERIREWGKPVRLHYHGMTERNETIVREASTPAADQALLMLPELLLEEARALRDSSPLQAYSIALRAVAIELWTKTPLRLGEMLGLRLDQHLQRPDPVTRRILYLSIPAEQRKNNYPYAVPVSKDTSIILAEWISFFRPIGASSDCIYLFPGKNTGNCPMTPQGMRDSIKKTLRQRVGIRFSPHTFRHLAGHHFLDEFPGHFGGVQRLLGHKDPTTAGRYYVSKENESAHREYDAIIWNRKMHVRSTAKLLKRKTSRKAIINLKTNGSRR